MKIRIEIESGELERFVDQVVTNWWEAQEGCATDPTTEDIVGYIEDHFLFDATNLLNLLAKAYDVNENVSMTIGGKSIDQESCVNNPKLKKLIDKVWARMTSEEDK